MRYCDGIGHIYCICCLANGKLYIGQTVKSIEKRFKEHKQAAKRGVPYRKNIVEKLVNLRKG